MNNGEPDPILEKLNKTIASREKQLADMVNMLAELNQQLNDVSICHLYLKNEKINRLK